MLCDISKAAPTSAKSSFVCDGAADIFLIR
jgi:hypothetical protein